LTYPAIKQVETTTFHFGLLSNSFNTYSISAHECSADKDANFLLCFSENLGPVNAFFDELSGAMRVIELEIFG